MGNSRYSLMKYSLPDAGAEISLSFKGNERLNCVTKFGSNLLVGCKFAESMQGNQKLTLIFYQAFDGQSALDSDIVADIAANLGHVDMGEELTGNFFIAADIHPAEMMAEALLGDNYLSVDAKTDFSANEIFSGELLIGANVKTSKIFSEILSCDIDVITLSKEIMQLNVTIPAGGRLMIDTDLYVMTVNDENAIHLHHGDWIWLERDLIMLTVDSGTGGSLVGKVIYNERYL